MKQRVFSLFMLGVALCAAWPAMSAETATAVTEAETAATAAAPVMRVATMPKYLAAKGEGGAMFGFALSAYPRIVIEQNGPQFTFKVIGDGRSIGGVVTLSFSEDPINRLKPAIVERSEDVRAEKFLRDGVLYIRQGDRIYNLHGILQNE